MVTGTVFKYGDNVDTDVIIPARYLNAPSPAELASHCMEDIDADFASTVQPGDIIVADGNGVTVVPRDCLELVLERCEARAQVEKKRMVEIRQGQVTAAGILAKLEKAGY